MGTLILSAGTVSIVSCRSSINAGPITARLYISRVGPYLKDKPTERSTGIPQHQKKLSHPILRLSNEMKKFDKPSDSEGKQYHLPIDVGPPFKCPIKAKHHQPPTTTVFENSEGSPMIHQSPRRESHVSSQEVT